MEVGTHYVAELRACVRWMSWKWVSEKEGVLWQTQEGRADDEMKAKENRHLGMCTNTWHINM